MTRAQHSAMKNITSYLEHIQPRVVWSGYDYMEQQLKKACNELTQKNGKTTTGNSVDLDMYITAANVSKATVSDVTKMVENTDNFKAIQVFHEAPTADTRSYRFRVTLNSDASE